MLITIILSLVISMTVISFSYFGLVLFESRKKFENEDFVYGLFFLSLISLVTNFFFPLEIISYFIIILGVIFFIYLILKKKINLNIIHIIWLNSFLIFISYKNALAYDSQLYHLQTIKYNSINKIIFGLSNLEPRLAMNSSWHSLLALFNVSFKNINLIYIFNISIYSFFINIIFTKLKKNYYNISHVFFGLSIIYILVYSQFHPNNNGTIMNNLGSPEVDTIAMFFFIFCIFLTINFFLTNSKFNLLLVSSVFLITIKISYISVSLLILYIFLKNKKFFFEKKIILVFTSFFSFLWVLRNFIISGCFIFPINFTCFNVTWSMGSENVKNYKDIVMAFNRDTPLRNNWFNFDQMIHSYEWFIPWFKAYFLKTEFLYVSAIFSFIFLIVFLILYLFNFYKNSFFLTKDFIVLKLVLFVAIYIWINSPEIRLGYGSIISFTIYSFILNLYFIKKNFKIIRKLKFITVLLCFILVFKNFENQKNFKEKPFDRDFNYKNFELLYISNNYKVYKPSSDPFCNYFLDFCSYQSLKVNIFKKNNYFYIFKK